MAEQKKKETKPTKPAEGEDGGAGSAELSKKGKKIKEELDSLLDEIDDSLEENAEEFVKSYVQRGGQSPPSRHEESHADLRVPLQSVRARVREIRAERAGSSRVPRLPERAHHPAPVRLRSAERRRHVRRRGHGRRRRRLLRWRLRVSLIPRRAPDGPSALRGSSPLPHGRHRAVPRLYFAPWI